MVVRRIGRKREESAVRHNDIGEDLRPLIFDFFFWFSRFECALKENGRLQFKNVGACACPDWSGFIAAYSSDYTPSEGSEPAH
jgi:hypothetical protein